MIFFYLSYDFCIFFKYRRYFFRESVFARHWKKPSFRICYPERRRGWV